MDGKRAAPRKGRRVVFVGDGVSASRQRGSAALGDGFPRQSADWLGMTGNGAMWASTPTKSRGVRAGRDGERWGKMFTLAALTLGNYYCIIN